MLAVLAATVADWHTNMRYYKPGPDASGYRQPETGERTYACDPCAVRWWGPNVCWSCGQPGRCG